MNDINEFRCASCGYEREEHDTRNPRRCPKCNQRYLFSREGYMLGEEYRPNHIPLFIRRLNIILSVIFLSYGGYGIYINDLVLFDKLGRILHLTDKSAWTMYAALICGVLVMLSEIVDHYDKRDNEHKYQIFSKIFGKLGWGLFIGSLTLWLYQKIT